MVQALISLLKRSLVSLSSTTKNGPLTAQEPWLHHTLTSPVLIGSMLALEEIICSEAANFSCFGRREFTVIQLFAASDSVV